MNTPVALSWYARSNGIENPVIVCTLRDGDWEIDVWNCGALPQPSASEIEDIVEQYESDQEAIDNFNTDLLLARMNELLDLNAIGSVSPYQGTLVEYCRAKNFYSTETEDRTAEGFIQWLVDNEHATEPDAVLIKQAFAEQGIDF